MSANKNFVVRQGLEVAENLIYADGNSEKVGIGTTSPYYTLDVKGDVSLDNRIYLKTVDSFVKSTTGIVSVTAPNSITGFDTSSIRLGDFIDDGPGGVIRDKTRIISIAQSSINISPPHTRFSTPHLTVNLTIERPLTSGEKDQIIISDGEFGPPRWVDFPKTEVEVEVDNTDRIVYPTFVAGTGNTDFLINQDKLTFNPSLGYLGIGTDLPTTNLDVEGNASISGTASAASLNVENEVIAEEYFGDGVNLVGIVTNLVPGIGVDLFPTQTPGNKGEVKIQSYKPIGKTIYVSQTGDDENTGLAENHPKRTIKAAAAIAFPGDTIKVFPGMYVEDNPIRLLKNVAVEGTELRNCVVTPRFYNKDLFHVNNSCHITDLSFIGTQDMTDAAGIVALQPLSGVSVDRFFDAARMIRYNLDFIANETVGFLTSGFSGFAGSHREQDAARLIDLNIDFIAAEAVGFLTSPSGLNFTVPEPGTTEDCSNDIKDILRSISYDLKANSNKKTVGAALSYFSPEGNLIHISEPGVPEATIDTLIYAVGIAQSVINNLTPPLSFQSEFQQTIDPSVILVEGGCVDVSEKISDLVGIITSTVSAGNTFGLPEIQFGVTLESEACAKDIKDIWKCVIHDITRGGNSRCVSAGQSYFDSEWNLIPEILKNPGEVEQTVASVDYSFNVARAIINNSTWGGFPAGIKTDVTNALYDEFSGITTITAINHGLNKDDAVKIVGLGFTCPSDGGQIELIYPSGAFGFIFNVDKVLNDDNFEVVVGHSTLPHTYTSGGTIQKYDAFQHDTYQLKDLSIQPDPFTGFNNAINGCANVVSAIHSCVGIVTNIVGLGSDAFNVVGIKTTYPGNAGFGITTINDVTDATYDNETGTTVITVPSLNVKKGDIIEVRDLLFECPSNGSISTLAYPSGKFGYLFDVIDVNNDEITINVGVSTIVHDYVSGGFVVNRSFDVTDAFYENTTGITTITANNLKVRTGQIVTIRDLEFSCPSGSGTTTIYPTGSEGFEFRVLDVVIDKPFNVSSADYDNVSGITTITAPGLSVDVDDIVEIRDLEFSCPDSPPNLLYPSGKDGYTFRVISASNSTFSVNVGVSTVVHTYVSGGFVKNVTQRENDTFTIQVGVSTIPHDYVSGGVVIPEYSPGVGPITQGPYVRNCTNFVAKSIGMKVDGFAAEPGDKDDIGVTGTMSVDSYTQFNQAGVGVSITNGAYAQLVSIFTICNDTAIFTGSGGQCDITNSNSSFGNFGLVSEGVGDENSKSIYRYTGIAQTALAEQPTITVSNIGDYRPYDGQALYFGELFFTVQRVEIVDGGSGYTTPPNVSFEFPSGPNGIRAEAIATIQNGRVVSVDLISTGTQYRTPPIITFTGGGGSGASAKAIMNPIYYTINSATLPSAGISTITLNTNLNSTVSGGTIVYFTRLSLQLTSSHSFEWVGSGNDINTAKPALGGVVRQENEVVKIDGGQVVYTSTDQAGNFRIGDGLVVNQLTGTVSGRAFSQSLINTVTPLIIALGN